VFWDNEKITKTKVFMVLIKKGKGMKKNEENTNIKQKDIEQKTVYETKTRLLKEGGQKKRNNAKGQHPI